MMFLKSKPALGSPAAPAAPAAPKPPKPPKPPLRPWKKWLLRLTVIGTVLAFLGMLILALTMALIYPKLPSMESVTDYRPKIPLRVYSADNALLAEFGEERRTFVRIQDVPLHMKQAILAIEDDRFYQHMGIDFHGIARAMLSNVMGGSKQGASTITQQVARNFFLSNEQTLKRKVYEVLLSFKLERQLSKDQIFELYLNQIYLGERAYGFASACQTYFGIPLSKVSIEQAAMLAGIPKAPAANNPRANFERAKKRSNYILERMLLRGYITAEQHAKARANPMIDEVQMASQENDFKSDYVAEMVRKIVHDKYGDAIYGMGLEIYTTILKADQAAAYNAVRKGLLDYDRRHGYRGAESFVKLSPEGEARDDEIIDALEEHRDNDQLLAAVVLSASPKKLTAVISNGETITVLPDGLRLIANNLTDKSADSKRVTAGSVIRVIKEKIKGGKDVWAVTQIPDVEAAHIAINPYNGAVRALIGGFDFNKSKFNHVTQGWRQPGSSFKPFVYSAAVDIGYNGNTVVSDTPFSVDAGVTGGKAWEPKNYDGKFEGSMSMATALAKSKNMVSIRLMQAVGATDTQNWITRFGFDASRHPPYLTMALGAGSTNPWQMSQAYAVFANGGYKVNAFIINKVLDGKGNVLMQAKPKLADDEANRVIPADNAYIMHTLLQGVVARGTAVKANSLKRSDLAGKTGTTNDAFDAWFAGYASQVVGITWVGFDSPKSLGDKETGGGVALPIWIEYMAKVLPGIPEEAHKAPPRPKRDEGDAGDPNDNPDANVDDDGATPTTLANDAADLVRSGISDVLSGVGSSGSSPQ
jgi:penicillin-binding protein 1A